MRYFDHHAIGDEVPTGALFEAMVDTASDTCTSLLVDRRIAGACHGWALVGAYGDNLTGVADRLASDWGYGKGDRLRLRRMGEAINYNAYGNHEPDVLIVPARLYEIMVRYRDPRDMLAHESVIDEIDALRRQDVLRALAIAPYTQDPRASVLLLPDEPWSRLLMFIATLREHGAGRVSAVVPYLAYARKDRRTQPYDPVSLRHVARLFEAVETDQLITLEVHNVAAFQSAFRCQTVHLNAYHAFDAVACRTHAGQRDRRRARRRTPRAFIKCGWACAGCARHCGCLPPGYRSRPA